jgi:hypothetical protein
MKRASKHTLMILIVGSVGSVIARPALAAPPADPAETPIPPAQPVVVAPVAPSGPVVVQPSDPVEAQPAPSTSAGRGLLIAGICLAAASGGFAGAGVFFGLKAKVLDDDAKNLGGAAGRVKSDQATTYRKAEYVSYGVGAASFVAGGALIIWGIVRRVGAASTSPPQQVAVVPIVGPSLGGAALSASF